jgi:hypothetical protein
MSQDFENISDMIYEKKSHLTSHWRPRHVTPGGTGTRRFLSRLLDMLRASFNTTMILFSLTMHVVPPWSCHCELDVKI